MATIKFSGIAVRKYEKDRIANALVKITAKEGIKPPGMADDTKWTDADGRFEFDMPKEGEYKVHFLHAEYKATIFDLKVGKDPTLDVEYPLFHLTNNLDKSAGQNFLYTCIAFLVFLFIVYISMHNYCLTANGPISDILLVKIDSTLEKSNNNLTKKNNLLAQYGKLVELDSEENNSQYYPQIESALQISDKVTAISLFDSLQIPKEGDFKKELTLLKNSLINFNPLNTDTIIKSRLSEIETELKTILKNDYKIVETDKRIMLNYLANAKKQQHKNDHAAIGKSLNELHEYIEAPPVRGFLPWTKYPWMYLEVIFWAFAGILVRKIIKAGSYLRFNSFYKEGLNMHWSHIFGAPLLVLVAILILSIFKLSISFAADSGSPLVISLENPYILAAASFILAASPWATWGLIERTGDRLAANKPGNAS